MYRDCDGSNMVTCQILAGHSFTVQTLIVPVGARLELRVNCSRFHMPGLDPSRCYTALPSCGSSATLQLSCTIPILQLHLQMMGSVQEVPV